MDFDVQEEINESEIDELGIKKKADAAIDTDDEETDEVSDHPLVDEEEKEEEDPDKGVYGDDAQLEEYMFNGDGENEAY